MRSWGTLKTSTAMQIPDLVKVGGHWIKVSQPSVVDPNDEDTIGESWVDQCSISLQADMEQSKKEEIFLHELIHTINPNLAEDVVQPLAFSLYQVLSDNGLLA